jgi:hypothetical protein
MIAWIFAIVVLAIVGKLVYDKQQSKKPTQTENGFDKDTFQKLAGIKPTNPNDEIRQILVKNNIFAKEQIIEALLKAAENSEFPKQDETINVRTTKITTIDTNFGSDNDPLASVPMSRVSKAAKQKMAEIAKQDISDRLDAQTKQMLESELGPVIDQLAKEVLAKPKAKRKPKSVVNIDFTDAKGMNEIDGVIRPIAEGRVKVSVQNPKVMGEYQLNNKEKVRKSLIKNKK